MLDILRLSTGYLGEHGSASARLDAELLVAHGLGIARLDVYLQFERPLTGAHLTDIRELVRRRGRGEPIAYITGTREFYGRPFSVNPGVLIPRPETETLVERALLSARERGGEVLIADIATGSGCVACSLAAELPRARVIASDVSVAATLVAIENARRLGLADRIEVVEAAWADALPDDVDIVVSNPPYVSTAELAGLARDVAEFEPRLALDGGDDGLAAYRRLLPEVARRCPRLQWLGLEVDSGRADAVAALAAVSWPAATIRTVSDLSHRPRVVEISPGSPAAL